MARASSVCVMMNKKMRRLSKMPVEVHTEIQGYFVDKHPVVAEDKRKLTKLDDNTAKHIHKGLTARWSDLDVNRHVNNVKYIGWILEAIADKGLELLSAAVVFSFIVSDGFVPKTRKINCFYVSFFWWNEFYMWF
ncbi:hypothetical protein Droror1_Dr00000222 [Drosera rotundifolia]